MPHHPSRRLWVRTPRAMPSNWSKVPVYVAVRRWVMMRKLLTFVSGTRCTVPAGCAAVACSGVGLLMVVPPVKDMPNECFVDRYLGMGGGMRRTAQEPVA